MDDLLRFQEGKFEDCGISDQKNQDCLLDLRNIAERRNYEKKKRMDDHQNHQRIDPVCGSADAGEG
ncbi:hypothetical protein [Holdemania filiformis]|uniref:hypothetical protein n=1 Tax=Holdemania filiformis TaxID=61171 RepID=UPI003A9516D2